MIWRHPANCTNRASAALTSRSVLVTTTQRVNNGNATQMHMNSNALMRAFGVFLATTIAELLVCYFPVLWLSGKGSAWLLLPSALSLVAFVWLLTLHPDASGRVYATYGAAYTATAIGWLYLIGDVV
jgi:small multidrug resistance family-3 protein